MKYGVRLPPVTAPAPCTIDLLKHVIQADRVSALPLFCTLTPDMPPNVPSDVSLYVASGLHSGIVPIMLLTILELHLYGPNVTPFVHSNCLTPLWSVAVTSTKSSQQVLTKYLGLGSGKIKKGERPSQGWRPLSSTYPDGTAARGFFGESSADLSDSY